MVCKETEVCLMLKLLLSCIWIDH